MSGTNHLFINDLNLWQGVAYTLAALIQCALLLNVVAVGAIIVIWLERKVSGRIKDRLGPTRVGGKLGWPQTLAESLERRTRQAEEKIARAEAQAVGEVRAAAVESAVAAAERILQGKMTGTTASGLIDQGIRDLKGKLN